jgi:hypothetical protein
MTSQNQGEVCAAAVRDELSRLGLPKVEAHYVPERHVVQVTWNLRHESAATEGIEFPASGEWVERVEPVLRAYGLLGRSACSDAA